MDDGVVSGEQRVRLLELEERQRQLKRLCEEALREDEEHQHIFQQLEEHNVAASNVGSFRGTGSSTGFATQPVRPADEQLDDLMTGEVRSFRDPNSITRASSTGSVVAGLGSGGSNPRLGSMDRPPMTRLGAAYRPPTYPTAPAAASGPEQQLAGASVLPPPPPPRATLYSATRQPRRESPSAGSRGAPGSSIPPPPPPGPSDTSIPPSWRRGGSGSGRAAVDAAVTPPTLSSAYGSGMVGTGVGRTAPLASPTRYASPTAAPPPPPPTGTAAAAAASPRMERSRSLSHSVPLPDSFQRSGDYHVRSAAAAAPPPPPPPPSASTYTAARTAYSPRYGGDVGGGLRSPAFRATTVPPPPPPPPSSSALFPPDEVSESLPPPPPPPPRPNRTAPTDAAVTGVGSAAAKYRSKPLFVNRNQPPPPPPPPAPAAEDDSVLSTTSTDRDVARWRHQLQHNDAALRQPLTSSAEHSPQPRAPTRWTERAQDGPGQQANTMEAWSYSARGGGRFQPPSAGLSGRGVAAPPPPPPPPPAAGDDDDDRLPNRWDTVSQTSSVHRAEEARLRRYFTTADTASSRQRASYLDAESGRRVSDWRAAAARSHRQPQPFTSSYVPSSARDEGAASARARGPVADTTPTALHYDETVSSIFDSSRASLLSDAAPRHRPPPPPPPPPLVEETPSAPPAPLPKAKKTVSHPYGDATAVQQRVTRPPLPPTSDSGRSVTPLYSALYAKQHQHPRSASAGLNSSRDSVWDGAAPASAHASGAAGGNAPQTAAAPSSSEFFDLGPEKEALLTLLRESTRAAAAPPVSAADDAYTAAGSRGGSPPFTRPSVPPSAPAGAPYEHPPYPSTTAAAGQRDVRRRAANASPKSSRRPSNASAGTGLFSDGPRSAAAQPPRTGSPSVPFHDASAEALMTPTARKAAASQLQRQCEAAQTKAEALARHLVKAITDRNMLQGNVEELEQLVEECNAEVGRLQRIVEEQHEDASSSLGVQAALRAKEHEVAVYEEELRRLNSVLEEHLARTATTRQAVQDGASQSLVTKEAEVEAAMMEVGMAHVAQREAEERASQLANELETAVEQIQFLDERLAEMERAAAAAQFDPLRAYKSDDSGTGVATADGVPFRVPTVEETREWPAEARRAMAQLASQAQRLLQQNAEGERHASMRLQHMEQACTELQQHLQQRGAEVARAREACAQLHQEKKALQTCGEQLYQQLREVKEDAQLVSEMVRTARGDAEEVYLSSRVAAARVAEQQAAAAARSPFLPAAPAAAVDVATLDTAAHFARQVMSDFHAVARFLSSLRSMDIGDRNAYAILQSIAGGRSPAEGLYITADDAATPLRQLDHLATEASSEAKRRVQEKKARVLQAVERALTLDAAPATPMELFHSQSRPSPTPSPAERPVAVPLGLPPRADGTAAGGGAGAAAVAAAARAALTRGSGDVTSFDDLDALMDDAADELEAEVEVVEVAATAALQPPPPQSSSHSYRGGSSGMVHSDVRRGRPEAQSLEASQKPTVPAPAQSSPTRPTVNGQPLCSALFMGDAEPHAAPSSLHHLRVQADAADGSPSTPPPAPPSVSRPLRLSTTPSQPQSELRGVAEMPAAGAAAPARTPVEVPRESPLHSTLTADSVALEEPVAEDASQMDRGASTITVVSSPSVSPHASEQPCHPQSQQHERTMDSATQAQGSAPTAAMEQPTFAPAAAAAPPTRQPISALCRDGDTTLPSVSDIAVDDGSRRVAQEDTPKRSIPPPASLTPRQGLQSPLRDEEGHDAAASLLRLHSPTPDGPEAVPSTRLRASVLISSPLERPRPSQLSVDEPPPRAVLEESPPMQPGSHPKDRSRTARPPSTPPAPEAPTAAGVRGAGPPSRGVRRAASDDDDDGEATLFFREPPRGVVHEVVPTPAAPMPSASDEKETTAVADKAETATRVEVSLLSDTFVMPSSGQSHSAAALYPPPRTPTMAPSEKKGSSAGAATASFTSQPQHTEATEPPSTLPTADAGSSTSKKETSKERARLPQLYRVVDDDDDEPSLQFAAPAPLPAPPSRSSSATHLEADGGPTRPSQPPRAKTRDTSPLAASLPKPVQSPTSLGASPSTDSHAAFPSHRPLHQPRRSPQAADAGPSLTALGSVAPPRLQRSTTASPSASASLEPSAVPGPVAAAAAAAPRASSVDGRRSSVSHSADRAATEGTPALAEPQRAAPASRAEVMASTAARPEPASVLIAAHDLSAVDELEAEEDVAMGAVRSGTATPHRGGGGARPPSALGVVECDALTADSKAGEESVKRSPSRRLLSDATTATPGSPPESDEGRGEGDNSSMLRHVPAGDSAAPGLGLPHAVCSDTPGSLSMNVSQPADPLPAAPGAAREPSGRAMQSGLERAGGAATATARRASPGESEPAPLPTVNVDSPESNTLGLRRAAPQPPAETAAAAVARSAGDAQQGDGDAGQREGSSAVVSEVVSSPPNSPRSRSGGGQSAQHHQHNTNNNSSSSSSRTTTGNNSSSSEAAAKRREDVTRILERIRAKKEQEQRSGAATPTKTSAASPTSSSRPDSDYPSFAGEEGEKS